MQPHNLMGSEFHWPSEHQCFEISPEKLSAPGIELSAQSLKYVTNAGKVKCPGPFVISFGLTVWYYFKYWISVSKKKSGLCFCPTLMKQMQHFVCSKQPPKSMIWVCPNWLNWWPWLWVPAFKNTFSQHTKLKKLRNHWQVWDNLGVVLI